MSARRAALVAANCGMLALVVAVGTSEPDLHTALLFVPMLAIIALVLIVLRLSGSNPRKSSRGP